MPLCRFCIAALLLFYWVSGLPGQEQEDAVAHRLFAATTEGPFESHNWGEDWFPIQERLPQRIRTFACIGPQAFAGGADGMYASVDFGKTWDRVEQWNGEEVLSIAASSYFGVEPVVFAGTGEGLYRSVDGGMQWERVAPDTITGAVYNIAWPGPALFIATSRGLYRSEDGGDTWSADTHGLGRAPLLSLAFSRFFREDPVAFVGTDGAGVFRTRDGGETFFPLRLPARRIYSLYWWGASLLAGTEDGLFVSKNAGESWDLAAPQLEGTPVHTIWIPAPDAPAGSEIFLGTPREVLKSSDGGRNWRRLTRGMSPAGILGFGSFPVTTLDDTQRPR